MPADKLAHFAMGILIAGVALEIVGSLWALVAVLAAAIGKEIYDWYRHGKPDVWDAVATLAGGLIVLGAVWIAA